MRPSKYSEKEIVQALREVKEGTPAIAMCRRLGVTQTTFYRWRTKYCGTAPADGGELRTLRDENHRLKQIVANLLLERHTSTDAGRRGK